MDIAMQALRFGGHSLQWLGGLGDMTASLSPSPTLVPSSEYESPARAKAEAVDGEETETCNSWDGDTTNRHDHCSAFLVTRLSSSMVDDALARALRCAATWGSRCVLSTEIGFPVPSAFLYDERQGVRLVLAPRLLANEQEEDAGETRVRLHRGRDTSSRSVVLSFNRSVRVEHYAPQTRRVVVETLTGHDAFCVQSLRRAVDANCWAQLDGE
jgi:hypothetical protein